MSLMRILSLVIALFGIGALYIGISGLLIVDTSVRIMQEMREAGSNTLDGVDFSVLRIILYINSAIMALLGVLSIVSGLGIFLRKKWARLLWKSTLMLMAVWTLYGFIMSSVNRGLIVIDVFANTAILLFLAALFYFFSRRKTKSYFEVN
jgi:hypothetical protein